LLKTSDIIAFVGVSDAGAARTFYRDTLGLTLVSEDGFALVFDANGTMLRVTLVPEVRPVNYTVLGWQVSDIIATAKLLNAAGVELQRYPGLNDRDELGIWTAPSGARIAWFKDPDGNVLSITQF
jgi:catechol 2,3-dioxygenase-like lactoylglutathione lyase family enzyme